jgi:protein-S-isoprenylcysteine O-methyltransferase Ste14
MQIDDDSPRVRVPPPLIFLVTLLAGNLIENWLDAPRIGLPSPARFVAAGVFLAAGLIIILAAANLFRRAGTHIEPWRSSSAIVCTGVYRWSRNPIYLSMAIIYIGLALGFGSVIALALLPVAILIIRTQVIAREERYLEAKFGDAYRSYKMAVRRWF